MVSLFWLLVVTLMSILGNSFSPQRALTRTTVVKAQSLRQTVMALTNEDAAEVESSTTRRGALRSILGLVQGTLIFDSFDPKSATALDMDAFINSQLDADTKNCDPSRNKKCLPKLSADEAMCKYGQSGVARGEACRRVKELGGALPKAGTQVKSLGGAYAM